MIFHFLHFHSSFDATLWILLSYYIFERNGEGRASCIAHRIGCCSAVKIFDNAGEGGAKSEQKQIFIEIKHYR